MPYVNPAELDYSRPAQEVATDKLRELGPEPFRVAVAEAALGSASYNAAEAYVKKLTKWGSVEYVSGSGRQATYRVVS